LTGVVELFGYIRETNYGQIFDVVTRVDPRNLAFTSLPLGPHTDNPYRDPVPTLQLLHCLASSAGGGESIFVDGLEAAAVLAAEDPDAFGLLSELAVQWRYVDESAELICRAPVLGVDGEGLLTTVRFNERARVPSTFTSEVADAHLRALRTFAALLERRDLQLRLRLEPGELVCFDNLRVLHGRTGFDAGGERHLQGCYADRDGLASRLAVLRRLRAQKVAAVEAPGDEGA
jgi:gamma-butyrobetaine dioxygenase